MVPGAQNGGIEILDDALRLLRHAVRTAGKVGVCEIVNRGCFTDTNLRAACCDTPVFVRHRSGLGGSTGQDGYSRTALGGSGRDRAAHRDLIGDHIVGIGFAVDIIAGELHGVGALGVRVVVGLDVQHGRHIVILLVEAALLDQEDLQAVRIEFLADGKRGLRIILDLQTAPLQRVGACVMGVPLIVCDPRIVLGIIGRGGDDGLGGRGCLLRNLGRGHCGHCGAEQHHQRGCRRQHGQDTVLSFHGNASFCRMESDVRSANLLHLYCDLEKRHTASCTVTRFVSLDKKCPSPVCMLLCAGNYAI